MNVVVRQIPNFFTLLNLISGLTGITVLLKGGDVLAAGYFIMISAVFDLIDGAAARVLHVESTIGKHLDSLADVVSFGVLPGMMIVSWIDVTEFTFFRNQIQYIGLLLPIFAAIRLAKFNADDQQRKIFKGLPVPAAALFFAPLPLIYTHNTFEIGYFVREPMFLIVSVLIIGALMVSSLRMFSLKFSSFAIRQNGVRYLFLIISGGLIIVLKLLALPFIIVLYIFLSLVIRPDRK